MAAGAKGFVLKDAPADKLRDAINTALAGGTSVDRGISAGLSRDDGLASGLSRREREVLRLVGQGLPSKLIAQQLSLSLRTVESHRQNVKKKLQLKSNAELIKYAVEQRQGIPGIPPGRETWGKPSRGGPTRH